MVGFGTYKGSRKEVLVVCGNEMSAGISVWDMETGEVLRRIPTCASPPHGLLCHRNHFLAASQLQNQRSFAGGAIFFWPLSKPQAPHRSYPIETIGPIASTKDGIYLVGGSPSGNVYIWEVPSGRLLRNWRAHHTSLNCLVFSHDDSFLISGSDDGIICVWLTIRVLNAEDPQACGSLPPFHVLSEHRSSVTDLVPISGCSSPSLISSSLDGTCKVWDLVSGRLLQTYVFPTAINTIAVDPEEQTLFTGCEDGRILVNALHVGLLDIPEVISEVESETLCGHKGPITALTSSIQGLWLISASNDCTACLWDAASRQVIRRFNHRKGYITNLLVIPQSSLSGTENRRNCLQPRISSLQKCPHLSVAPEATPTLLPEAYLSHEENIDTSAFQTSSLLNKQLLDLEQGGTPEAIEMKLETSVENRLQAITMAKHMTRINKHLQSRLLDMIQYRLCHEPEVACVDGKKTMPSDPEEQTESLS